MTISSAALPLLLALEALPLVESDKSEP